MMISSYREIMYVTLVLSILTHANGHRRQLLPQNLTWHLPAGVPTGEKPKVRFGMPAPGRMSTTYCAPRSPGQGMIWMVFGRAPNIMHILAKHTGNLDGCINLYKHVENGASIDEYFSLLRGDVDLYGDSVYPQIELMDRIEYLYPHLQNNLCIMVPLAGPVKRSILLSFSLTTWTAIGITLLLCIAALKQSYQLGAAQAVHEIFATFLTGSFRSHHRFLMIWLSSFSLIMVNSFSGSFTQFLVIPGRGTEIDTLEEVDEKYNEIHAFPGTRELFIQNVDPRDITYKLALKFTNHSVQTYALDIQKALADGDPAIVDNEEKVELLIRSNYASRNGRPRYRKMQQCLLNPAFMSFPVRRDWPHRDYFSRLLQRLVETGIIKWLTESTQRQLNKFSNPGIKEKRPLCLYNILEPFLLWCISLTFCLLVFCAEKLRKRRYEQN